MYIFGASVARTLFLEQQVRAAFETCPSHLGLDTGVVRFAAMLSVVPEEIKQVIEEAHHMCRCGYVVEHITCVRTGDRSVGQIRERFMTSVKPANRCTTMRFRLPSQCRNYILLMSINRQSRFPRVFRARRRSVRVRIRILSSLRAQKTFKCFFAPVGTQARMKLQIFTRM